MSNFSRKTKIIFFRLCMCYVFSLFIFSISMFMFCIMLNEWNASILCCDGWLVLHGTYYATCCYSGQLSNTKHTFLSMQYLSLHLAKPRLRPTGEETLNLIGYIWEMKAKRVRAAGRCCSLPGNYSRRLSRCLPA